jgi:hypothetical protein
MQNRLILIVFGLGMVVSLSACVSSTSSSSASLSVNMKGKRQALLAAGHSKEYTDSYMTGCAIGGKETGLIDNTDHMGEAWQAGYNTCREQLLENLQKKNLHGDDGGRKTVNDYKFDEKQRMIWEELSK